MAHSNTFLTPSQVSELNAANVLSAFSLRVGRDLTMMEVFTADLGISLHENGKLWRAADALTRKQVGDAAWNAYRSHSSRLPDRPLNRRGGAHPLIRRTHVEDAAQSDSAATETT